ncbi:hypothetical protein TNCV_2536061 [Trichonephila clavipes]|nr:hypothetical protein TNCV_2536061 [Trichonephila clavipes]
MEADEIHCRKRLVLCLLLAVKATAKYDADDSTILLSSTPNFEGKQCEGGQEPVTSVPLQPTSKRPCSSMNL